jgi:hypothetical protein
MFELDRKYFMATPAQTEANRANTQLSTGPSSPEDRAKSSHTIVNVAVQLVSSAGHPNLRLIHYRGIDRDSECEDRDDMARVLAKNSPSCHGLAYLDNRPKRNAHSFWILEADGGIWVSQRSDRSAREYSLLCGRRPSFYFLFRSYYEDHEYFVARLS